MDYNKKGQYMQAHKRLLMGWFHVKEKREESLPEGAYISVSDEACAIGDKDLDERPVREEN